MCAAIFYELFIANVGPTITERDSDVTVKIKFY